MQIITICDCSKAETRKFYRERVIPRVPERIRGSLNFEVLYDALGGKLAHWHDYITDYGSCPYWFIIYVSPYIACAL